MTRCQPAWRQWTAWYIDICDSFISPVTACQVYTNNIITHAKLEKNSVMIQSRLFFYIWYIYQIRYNITKQIYTLDIYGKTCGKHLNILGNGRWGMNPHEGLAISFSVHIPGDLQSLSSQACRICLSLFVLLRYQ